MQDLTNSAAQAQPKNLSEPSTLLLDSAHITLYMLRTDKVHLDHYTLRQWLHDIRDGRWREQVLEAAALYPGPEPDKSDTAPLVMKTYKAAAQRYKASKDQLPCVTACGWFEGQHLAKNLHVHNQTCHGDVDHLSLEQIRSALEKLKQDPAVVYAFVGPSGHGLKYGVRIPLVTTNDEYRHAWEVVSSAHLQRYGLTWDRQAKDVSRLCYASYDLECYLNPTEPEVFPIPAPQPRKKSPRSKSAHASTPDSDRVREALRHIPADERNVWLQIGMALHSSGESWARSAWDEWSQTSDKYNEREQDVTWQHFNADGKVTIGTLYGMAQERGWKWQPTDEERREYARQKAQEHQNTMDDAMSEQMAWQAADAKNGHHSAHANGATNGVASPPPQLRGVTLLLTEKHKPRAVVYNVIEVLANDPRWEGVLGYNQLSEESTLLKCPPCYRLAPGAVWEERPVRDHDYTEISAWLQYHYELCASTSVVAEGVEAIAYRAPFHRIREYLQGLQWDGHNRLDTWLQVYCNAESLTGYTAQVGRKTLIGAVARTMNPGCKLDTISILEGEQGIRKSTTWRILAGDAWFSDSLPDLRDKDAMQTLRGKWFVEISDLAALKRNEVEVIKGFVSKLSDHYRPSYGRKAVTFPRQNIFVGSTNNDDYLKDDRNRRFWPIKLLGVCDVAALQRDRDQIWAEAYHRYAHGETWHLDAATEQLAMIEQDKRVEADDWEGQVYDYLATKMSASTVSRPTVSTKEVLEFIFKDLHPAVRVEQLTEANTRRVGRLLRRSNWRPNTVRKPGEKPSRLWQFML